MSDAKRCDECGRYNAEARWWRIEPVGIAVFDGLGRPIGPSGDFCSDECLAKHAADYRDAQAAMRRKYPVPDHVREG